ncbi:CHAT domain-containing protein [Siphonobacter aquaeclarae]|uniref:CHAT domain-containing protein n=1 Tax=Siphonobacter aquaeclarae TaxID=563176 RepID=A0A1G9NMX4_9BACT|nr:CHAT domain-containing tetratricopeptide repeat protein [Siphonobacter aquaeclarae]SDL87936.1 CHAT domain-containing protein [Siphonobacter aquaeclarae]
MADSLSRNLLIFFLLGILRTTAQSPEYLSFKEECIQALATPDSVRTARILQKWNRSTFPKDSLFIELTAQRALHAFFSRDFQHAVTIQQTAVTTAKSLRLPAMLAKIYYRLGVYLYNAGNTEAAKAYLENSIAYGSKFRQPGWAAHACGHLSFLFYNEGEYYKSLLTSRRGVSFALQTTDYAPLEKNRLQEAYALNELRLWDESRKVIAELAEKITPSSDVSLIFNLGIYLAGEYKDYQTAGTYYRKALQLHAQDPSWNTTGVQIAWSYTLATRERYDEALTTLQAALQTAVTRDEKARVLTGIGSVLRFQHQYAESIACFQRALGELLGPSSVRGPYGNPAPQFIRLSNRKEYLLTIIGDKAAALHDYSVHTSDKKLQQYALETYHVADKMIDLMRQEHTETRSKLFWRTETKPVYEGAIKTCLAFGNTADAFYFFEKSRSVLLSDRLNELSASQRLGPADARKELSFRNGLKSLRDQLAETGNSSRLSTRLDSLTRAQQAFIRSLEKTNPAYFRYKYDHHVPSLKAVQDSLLADNQSFVSYFFGDSVGYALGISKTGAVFKKWPLAGYSTDAQTFLRLCSQPFRTQTDARQFQEVSYRLYRRLLEPLGLRNASRLIISQDGAFLPFEALLTSPEKQDYLLRKHAVSYTYSAGFLLRPREESSSGRLFLGLAPERFAPSLGQQPLPGSVDALSQVEAHVSSPKQLIREDATKRNFLEQAADYRILQLFTHADADSTETREPVLYFADSALRLSELDAARQFRTRLLVLSACKTSVGVDQKGEGVFSLARGFAALGIPSIITTLWSVEDKATYGIIGSFYRYLAEGLPQDVALQKARLDAFQSDSQPYYWSGLIHIGESNAVPLAATPWWYWAGGGLFVAAGIWGLTRLKKAPTSSLRRGS